MNLEGQVRDALAAELKRQLAEQPDGFRQDPADPARVEVRGRLDLEELAMAVVGWVAGGP